MYRCLAGLYGSSVRATDKARDYRCKAPGCDRGTIYEDDEDGCYSRESGKCATCNGSGLLRELHPSAADKKAAE
jgi:hypothetical protein